MKRDSYKKSRKSKFSIINKALEYFFKEKFDRAAECFEEGFKEIENRGSVELRCALLCLLSDCYSQIGNYRKSLGFLHNALLEGPDLEGVNSFVSMLLDRAEKIQRNVASDVIRMLGKENNFASNMIISILNFAKNDFVGMEVYLKKAMEINPDNPYLFYYLAKCYSSKREYRNALALYDKFSDLKPKEKFECYFEKSECYYALILDCWRKGDIDNAKKLLEDIIGLSHTLKVRFKSGGFIDKQAIPLINVLEREYVLFNEIIPLDSRFQKIFECKTLATLASSLLEAFNFMNSLSIFPEILAKKTKSIFEPPIAYIIGVIKGLCIISLFKSLASLFPEKFDKKFLEIDFSKFSEGRKMLLNLRFMKGKQAIDAVENFIFILQHTKPDEISVKENELINLLKPAYVLSGELSRHMAEKEFKEGSFQSFRELIQQETKKSRDVILTSMKTMIGPLKRKTIITEAKKLEVKAEKAEYVIFLSRPSGIGVIRKPEKEKSIHKKYLEKKKNYDIFVYEQTVYRKVTDKAKVNMVIMGLDRNIQNLLILFLKYKNTRIPYEKLYGKAWEESITRDDNAALKMDAVVMNRLKTAITDLRNEFEYIRGFSIPHARAEGYICEGDFKFCVVLKKSTNDWYTLEGV